MNVIKDPIANSGVTTLRTANTVLKRTSLARRPQSRRPSDPQLVHGLVSFVHGGIMDMQSFDCANNEC